MIFLTVGTQEPFDRLVAAMDAWAATHAVPVFGQLGALKPASVRPAHFEWREFLSADDYQARLAACTVLVAHVGMGSIISALSAGKPLVMMPRRAALGEHRNEHQLATAAKFEGRPGLHIAREADELGPLVDAALAGRAGGAAGDLSPWASPELIAALRGFIAGST